MSDILRAASILRSSNVEPVLTDTKSQANKVAKLTDTVFHQSGTIFSIEPIGNRGIDHKVLPAGNYAVKFHPMKGFYLEMLSDFPRMGKIYGDAINNAARILNTYKEKNGNLGVLLDGLKGSGKTLLARLISIEGAKRGIPTLIINSALTGESFFHFLYSIQQECIVLFDEFEKVYDDKDQETLLTVLDGTFPSKKLFLLTSNDKSKVNSHLMNRPGRIHYYLHFKGLSAQFIREYIADNLKNKDHEKELLSVCGMFSAMNFDSLHTLVWEMNLYDEPAGKAIQMLNTKPESASSDIHDFELEIEGINFKFSGGFLSNAYGRVHPLSMSSYTIIPLIPAIPEMAAKLLNLPLEKVISLNPEAFENTEILIQRNKELNLQNNTNKKVDWGEHDFVESYHYEGTVRVPLVRIVTDNSENWILDGYNVFTPEHLVSIDIETGGYKLKNKKGGSVTMTRRKLVETSPTDYLRYMA